MSIAAAVVTATASAQGSRAAERDPILLGNPEQALATLTAAQAAVAAYYAPAAGMPGPGTWAGIKPASATDAEGYFAEVDERLRSTEGFWYRGEHRRWQELSDRAREAGSVTLVDLPSSPPAGWDSVAWVYLAEELYKAGARWF